MEGIKRFVTGHFELMLVAVLVAATAALVLVVADKIAFLGFFFIPTLVAAYFLGRRAGLLTGFLSVLMVALYAAIYPPLFDPGATGSVVTDIGLWACFLLLTAMVVGTLYEAKELVLRDLRDAYEGILEILAKYIDAVDSYTQDHSVRVSELGASLAGEIGLSQREVENIRVAGLLHDVGKIDVSLEVLTKASRLTPEEWEQMKRHTTQGASLLSPVGGLLRQVVPIVMFHHERWDGTGYHGLAGDDIPVGARVLAVADAYDSMVTDRPYRAGRTPLEACVEIERYVGTQFDPSVVKAFVHLSEKGLMEFRPTKQFAEGLRRA